MTTGSVVQLPDGTRGFDCNAAVGLEDARAFYERRYRFAMRYVRREQAHRFDLSRDEIGILFDAGLAVGPVQHVAPPGWSPTAVKGGVYGNVAVEECHKLGIPGGVTLWCDLEEVAADATAGDVIAFCHEWFAAVRIAGFLPGLYVGWNCGLTDEALYHQLAFQHYWQAYNGQSIPVVRGFQMRQHEAKPGDVPAGLLYQIDTNFVQRDKLGGLPTAFAPIGWSP